MTTPYEALQSLTSLDNKLNVATSLLRGTTKDHETLAPRLPVITPDFIRASLMTAELFDEVSHVKDPTPLSPPHTPLPK